MNSVHDTDNLPHDDPLFRDLDALRLRLDAERCPGPAWAEPSPCRKVHRLRWVAPAAAAAAAALLLLHVTTQPKQPLRTDLQQAAATKPGPANQADAPIRMTWQFPSTPALPETGQQNESTSRVRLPMPGSILPPKTGDTVTILFSLPRVQVPTRTERSTDDEETNDSRTAADPADGGLAGLVHPRPTV